MYTHDYKRVYVWELPVRIYHWLNVVSICALIGTGFIIADPPAIMSNEEANTRYWFGIVRFIHFVAAYIFAFSLLYRMYWAFVGNKFAKWTEFIPLTKKQWKNIWHVLKVDIFLMKDREDKLSNVSVGHNSLASLSYFIFFLFMAAQILTGFGLYAVTSEWWLPDLFEWVVPLMGGEFAARLVHHVLMWAMIVFIIIHVYLVFFHDWLEGRGEVSVIFGGYKFVYEERLDREEEEKELEKSEA